MSEAKPEEPRAGRPQMPPDYFLPGEFALLPWSWAEERLTKADNFWFSTTRPDGRPHAMPAWGVWLDGTLYFEGSPETRRARNIAANPNVSVHLESASEVVILEGEALPVGRPERSLAVRLAEIFTAKYSQRWDYRPSPEQWDEGGLWRLRPRIAFAWSDFPRDTTRWRFQLRE